MDINRIVCDGITDGPLTIPPFTLRQGQAICLQIPYPAGGGIEDRLHQLILGIRRSAGLKISGSVYCVNSLCCAVRRTWLQYLRDLLMPSPRAIDLLRKTGRMSYEQAAGLVARLGYRVNSRMNRFAGTPKTIIGLEAGMGSGAEVIFLSVAGLDPMGRHAVFSLVNQRLNRCSVIYLAYPFWFHGELYQDAVPGIPSLALGWPGSQLLPATRPEFEFIPNRAS